MRLPMPADVKHPVLGTLTWNGDLDAWESKTDLHSGCPIDFRLTRRIDVEPTENVEGLLRRGVEVLEWARRSESLCRQRIAVELLGTYNDAWAPEDAPSPTSRATFCHRISPSSLVLDVDGRGFFYWADDDLFAGRWIELRFRQDLATSEVGLAG
jgi:hypothetical protein